MTAPSGRSAIMATVRTPRMMKRQLKIKLSRHPEHMCESASVIQALRKSSGTMVKKAAPTNGPQTVCVPPSSTNSRR